MTNYCGRSRSPTSWLTYRDGCLVPRLRLVWLSIGVRSSFRLRSVFCCQFRYRSLSAKNRLFRYTRHSRSAPLGKRLCHIFGWKKPKMRQRLLPALRHLVCAPPWGGQAGVWLPLPFGWKSQKATTAKHHARAKSSGHFLQLRFFGWKSQNAQ